MGSFMAMEWTMPFSNPLIGRIRSIRLLLGLPTALTSNIREGGIWIRGMDPERLTLQMAYGPVTLRLISQMDMGLGNRQTAKEKLAYGRMVISRIIESFITNLYYLFYQLLLIWLFLFYFILYLLDQCLFCINT